MLNNSLYFLNMYQSCSHEAQENMAQTYHNVVSDDEDTRGNEKMLDTNEDVLEPLDYRRDWSNEIIDTFENLKSCFNYLEKIIR